MNTTNTQTQNSNLIISLYGSEIAVGIEGTREEITQQFNRFFNMGGAAPNCTAAFCSEDSDAGDNYIHFLSDRFAYFLSDEEAMIKALETEQLMNMNAKPNPEHKGKKDGILNEVKTLAKELYKNIKRENFMLYKTSEQVAFKKLDGGAPSLDMSSLNFFSTHAHVS
jgi:hypothetical protein